jgi:hypothetical protein
MKYLNQALVFLSISMLSISMYSQELYIESNAASINNEVNSTDGWGGNSSISSVSTDAYSGNYSIKVEAVSDGWARGEYGLDLVVGDEYEVIIYAKKTANSPNPSLTNWSGFNFNGKAQSITSIDWQEYKFNVVATKDRGVIKVYAGTPATVGNTVYLDNISISNLSNGSNTPDVQAPNTPTNVVISNITSDSANISWSASNDNGGGAVDGYKIYNDGSEIKDVSGTFTTLNNLTEQTQYNISVAAYDNANPFNISSPSSTISFTTLSSGGDSSSGDSGSEGNTGSESSSGNSSWTKSGSNVSVATSSDNVAIGRSTVPSGYKLAVEGDVRAREIRVDQDNWPDYVFSEDYKLPSLEEIQRYIEEKGHLPNIPSAKEVEENGVQLGEMNRLLLEKIEELTLYILKQEKRIKILEKKN